MPDGIGVFRIDTRDLRAAAEVIGRSRARLNAQDWQSPNWVPNVRNISFLDPYRDSSNRTAFYDNALAAVSTYVRDTPVMAGQYGLTISAFASVERDNVVTINVGHGNFLSNNSYAVGGQLDVATRAGLTYIASLVSQIRTANPQASIVLVGAYNGGTIANLASVTLGLPSITMISNPLTQDLVDASVSFMQGLSQQDPNLVPPEVANNPVRHQNIWHNSRCSFAECGPRLGLMFRRRACGVASADVRVSFA